MLLPDKETIVLLAEIDRDEARKNNVEKILIVIAALAIAAVALFASL